MSRCCWVFLFLALLLDDLNIGRVLFCCFLCHIGQQCGEVIVNLARFCITGRKRRLVVVVVVGAGAGVLFFGTWHLLECWHFGRLDRSFSSYDSSHFFL